jgi:hypothetical protein
MEARARTTQVDRHLKYTFNQDERNNLASELANAYYDRSELESQLSSIKADFKGRIGSLETQIEKHTRKIRDGYEMREIECEVQFHTPVDGQKRVVRLDTGEVVAVEYMLPHERQEILPFVVEEEPVQQEPARVWPVPNEHGCYDKGNNLENPPDLHWSAKGGKLHVIIHTLEIEVGWIRSLDYQFSEVGSGQPLHVKSGLCPSKDLALLEALDVLNSRITETSFSKTDKKHEKELKSWIETWGNTLMDRIGPLEFAKPNPDAEDLAYPEDKVERLRRDLGNGDYFEIKLLEVDEGVYQSAYEFSIGAFARIEQPITDLVEAEPRRKAIVSEIEMALKELANLTVAQGTKKEEKLKLQAAIESLEGYRSLLNWDRNQEQEPEEIEEADELDSGEED